MIFNFIRALKGLILLGIILIAGPAWANYRPLPFSYPHATLPQGDFEVEEVVDLTPVRVEREDADGTRAVSSLRSELQTEFEYGITNAIEAAFYLSFQQPAEVSPRLEFRGIKQRVRFQLNDAGAWPVDVGLYLEVAEFHNEFEFEQKVLLSRRFGLLSLTSNLWVEQEYYFQDSDWKFIYNPTLGGSVDLHEHVVAGLEYWARGRFDSGGSDGDSNTVHYLGPTLLLQSGEYWLSMGAYTRLDNLGESQRVGDPWGKLWFRALIGFGV